MCQPSRALILQRLSGFLPERLPRAARYRFCNPELLSDGFMCVKPSGNLFPHWQHDHLPPDTTTAADLQGGQMQRSSLPWVQSNLSPRGAIERTACQCRNDRRSLRLIKPHPHQLD